MEEDLRNAGGRCGQRIRDDRQHHRTRTSAQRRRQKDGEDQAIGRSKGGLSTKIHAMVDALGNPLAFFLTAGQSHMICKVPTCFCPRCRPTPCWRTRLSMPIYVSLSLCLRRTSNCNARRSPLKFIGSATASAFHLLDGPLLSKMRQVPLQALPAKIDDPNQSRCGFRLSPLRQSTFPDSAARNVVISASTKSKKARMRGVRRRSRWVSK